MRPFRGGFLHPSYLPKGFLTHAYDVLSGITKDVQFGPSLNEIRDAKSMVKNFERNSLTLYDRLYFHAGLAQSHHRAKNFYLARCRKNASKEIQTFFNDPWRKKQDIHFGKIHVHLIKVWNPKSQTWDVFATNLPSSWRKTKLVQKLYRLRWSVETSFFELTALTKIEQWHSKFINGILQELFALLWLINYTKIQILLRCKNRRNPLRETYTKPCFKLLFNFIKDRIYQIFKRVRGVLDDFEILAKRSTERRKYFSRAHPRELRGPASPYPYNNTVWAIPA